MSSRSTPDAVIHAIGTDGGSASVPAASVGGGSRVKDDAKARKNRSDRMDGYGRASLCMVGPSFPWC